MTSAIERSAARRSAHPLATMLWVLLFIGVPALIAYCAVAPTVRGGRYAAATRAAPSARLAQKAQPAPPPVEPVRYVDVAPADAREINAAVPFSSLPNPAARPFRFTGDLLSRDRAVDCLAAAQLYEAGDDPQGERAVAQVVLNRLRHPAFPKTVCGVVFEGSERATGCQFTFTCDGALGRTPSSAAWERARALASRMLSGDVERKVGYATHYHTDWVVPYWSTSLDKVTAVDTHLFFRWRGWWGTPPAFRLPARPDAEPMIAKLAFLSKAHAPLGTVPTTSGAGGPLGGSPLAIDVGRIGERFGPGRLAAISSAGDAFVLLLDKGAEPSAYDAMARQLCAGRSNCRVLGWTRAADTPNRFPIDDATLAVMSYAYIHLADANLERSLYNCREFAGAPLGQCMRQRNPMAAASDRP